jgi:hypothetical protein
MFTSEVREASIVHQNINSLIALVFVGSFAAGIGLIIWHACVGSNPIADFIFHTTLVTQAAQN